MLLKDNSLFFFQLKIIIVRSQYSLTHMDENIENCYVNGRMGSESSDKIIFLTFLKVRREEEDGF